MAARYSKYIRILYRNVSVNLDSGWTMGKNDDTPLAPLIADMQEKIPPERLRQVEPSEHVLCLDDIMTADLDLRVTEQQTDEEIVASISDDDTEDEAKDEEGDTVTDAQHVVHTSEVMARISPLKSYFESASGTDDSVSRILLTLEKNMPQSNQTQCTIMDFFKPVA